MRRVDFVLPYVQSRDVLDVGVVQHTVDAMKRDIWLHKHIQAAARSCLGIDVEEEGISRLKQEGFDVILADAQHFDLGLKFDVIVAGDVIEHLHDLKGFFESVSNHLCPGGRLTLMTPNPWFGARILQAAVGKPYENPEHTAWYSIGTLTELLDRFGFAVETSTYGSSENFLWKAVMVPKIIRHTSIWMVAKRLDETREPDYEQTSNHDFR
jgi:SAM-dependent methyltransferase